MKMAERAGETILGLKKISKHFPGVQALDSVDLDLWKGEVHALVGENGAGKSTLIKILSGVYQRDSGEILFEGRPVEIGNPFAALSLGIATVYQDPELAPDLSIAENIFMGALPVRKKRLIDWKRLYEDTRNLTTELGMQRNPRELVRGLGVAERQFIQIARAIALASKVVVLDEASAALTPRELETLTGAIHNLKSKGISVIYISHRIDEIFSLANRVTVLKDGKLVGTLDVKDTKKSDLIQMMVGRKLSEHITKANDVRITDEVLRVENLNRSGVVHDISFSVRRGEVVGIAGLVGSGRTELARVLFGADPYDSGKIYLKGMETHFKAPLDAINEKVAMLPENRQEGIVPVLSVMENVLMAALKKYANRGVIKKNQCIGTAENVVKTLGIKVSSIRQRIETLSGGNQQKVIFGKWLMTDADLIIFDEPTRGIDVGAKEEIYSIINDVIKNGKAVLMISSELPEILGMSDRILVMCQGRMVGEFSRSEATEEKIMHLCIGELHKRG
jgi:ribose transport system ATP-binding protein